MDSNEFVVCIKRRKLESLEDFYYSLKIYEKKLKDKYLMISKDFILQ
jgi:hypothetical protein